MLSTTCHDGHDSQYNEYLLHFVYNLPAKLQSFRHISKPFFTFSLFLPVPLSHFFLRMFSFIHLIISILATKIMQHPLLLFFRLFLVRTK